MPETRIVALLLADETVAAITTRVQPFQRFQGTDLPAITYQRVSTTQYNHSTGKTDSVQVRIQIDCWASTYSQSASSVKTLATAVRNALSGVAESGKTPDISMIHLIGEQDMSEPPDAGEQTLTYRVSQDYLVGYKE